MKKVLFFLGLALLLVMPAVVFDRVYAATETMVFDSTDNYIGACSYTATSTWTLTDELQVAKFQMWYKWQAGETELPITVTKDGAAFASFTATRSACDPYQTSWCNADYVINKTFPAGTYTTSIASAYQCLKPGGTGTVRLYSTTAATNTNETPNLIATANANTNAAVVNANTNTNATATKATKADSDDNEEGDILAYVLIGIIVVLLVVIVFMYMTCCKKKIAITK